MKPSRANSICTDRSLSTMNTEALFDFQVNKHRAATEQVQKGLTFAACLSSLKLCLTSTNQSQRMPWENEGERGSSGRATSWR